MLLHPFVAVCCYLQLAVAHVRDVRYVRCKVQSNLFAYHTQHMQCLNTDGFSVTMLVI
jgi:hypothetical protein